MSLAENLKRIRGRKGLSQAGLAKAAKVSQQSISRLEKGVDLTSKKLPAIAAALGCQLADLDDAYKNISPTVSPEPKMSDEDSATATLSELFSLVLRAEKDIQIEAIRVLEGVVPAHRRSRLTKTKAQ